MSRLDLDADSTSTDRSFSHAYDRSDRYAPDPYVDSDDFNVVEPEALHQIPFLDEKPRAWSRKKSTTESSARSHYESDWDEKRASRPSPLTGSRYGPQDGTEFQFPPQHVHAYRDRRYSRPLLEYARNEWQNDLYDDSSPSSPTSSDYDPSLLQMISTPRFRRYVLEFLAIMSLMSLIWVTWIGWVQPAWAESRALNEVFNETMKESQVLFGHNMTPAFLGMVQLKNLDRKLLPHKGDKKRLVVVGDVHGCHDERKRLIPSRFLITKLLRFVQ